MAGRRYGVVALAALILALGACSPAANDGAARSPDVSPSSPVRVTDSPGPADGSPGTSAPSSPTASPFGDELMAVADVLATAGVATYDDATFMVARPADGPEVLGITAFQLTNIVAEAEAGGGLAAGTLNGLAEPLVLEMDEGSLVVPLSMLIAAYVSAVDTPGAAYARELMGDVDAERHAEYRYPMVVVATFVGDALHDAAAGGAARQPTPVRHRVAISATGPLAVVAGARVAIDPCAAAQGLLDQLPGLLAQLVVPENSGFWGAIAGAVIGTVAEIAVRAAVSAIRAALGKIRAALATAAAAFYTASLLRTWTVSVSSDAGDYHYRVDGGPGGGVFSATVAGGQGVNWPAWMQSCAALFDLTLPQVQEAAGSAITWSPQFGGHAAAAGSADATVGASGSAAYPFETSTETAAEHSQNQEQIASISITAVVSRSVDPQQITALINALFAGVPDVVAAAGGGAAAAAIGSLSDVSGSGTAVVRHHKGQHASVNYMAGGGRIYAFSCDGPLGDWTFQLEIADDETLTTPNPVVAQFTFSAQSRTAPLSFTYTTNYDPGERDPYIETFVNDWQMTLVNDDTAIDVSGTTKWAGGEGVQPLDEDPGWQQILPFQISRADVPECAQP